MLLPCYQRSKITFIYFLIILVNKIASQDDGTSCLHDSIQKHNSIHASAIHQGKTRFQRNTGKTQRPIRITPYYVDNRMQLSTKAKAFLRDQLFPDTIQYFNSTLSVQPVAGQFAIDACFTQWSSSFSVAGRCRILKSINCGPRYNYDKIIQQHFHRVTYCSQDTTTTCQNYGGGGVGETDFLLYVYATNEGACQNGQNLAVSSTCVTDSETGRPIVGFIDICSSTFHQINDYETYRHIMAHELFHSLGFSATHFQNFRRPDGTKYNATRTFVANGKKTTMFTSPKVVQTAREYYNCNSLQGVPLEDNGASNSIESHWEMKILYGEIMTAAIAVGLGKMTTVSPITLAAMEDSGWYKVNYNSNFSQHKMEWGKGLGCNFLFGSCTNKNDYPYTCQANTKGCNFNYLTAATCRTNKWLDGCRIYMPIVGKVCFSTNNETNLHECNYYYGADSRCAVSNLASETCKLYEGGICIKTICGVNTTSNRLQLKLQLADQEIVCSYNGEKLNFNGFSHDLICPPVELACQHILSAHNDGLAPILCPPMCSSCSTSKTCHQCHGNYYLYNYQCYLACPPGVNFQFNKCVDDEDTIVQVIYEVIFLAIQNNLTPGRRKALIQDFQSQLNFSSKIHAVISMTIDNQRSSTAMVMQLINTNRNLSQIGNKLNLLVSRRRLKLKLNDKEVFAYSAQQVTNPVMILEMPTTTLATTYLETRTSVQLENYTTDDVYEENATIPTTIEVTRKEQSKDLWNKLVFGFPFWAWILMICGGIAGLGGLEKK
ncbi:Leishmanolysin-like peptidase [Trichoplax sp. H2]|nr:Leishmanolysin-like peptidase [Trichoplax sp. H2]|eukprot:RDD40193.1 Leishmanolysin-like peptidase [Trichoplax sp. H2]